MVRVESVFKKFRGSPANSPDPERKSCGFKNIRICVEGALFWVCSSYIVGSLLSTLVRVLGPTQLAECDYFTPGFLPCACLILVLNQHLNR